MGSRKFENPKAEVRCAPLRRVKTIAVVGLSPNPTRPSDRVSQAMQGFGDTIAPVVSSAREVLGPRAYHRLGDVPVPIDLVNVFRRGEFIDGVVDDCVGLGLKSVWIQWGIVNDPAAFRDRAGGMMMVMDRCIYGDYRQYCS